MLFLSFGHPSPILNASPSPSHLSSSLLIVLCLSSFQGSGVLLFLRADLFLIGDTYAYKTTLHQRRVFNWVHGLQFSFSHHESSCCSSSAPILSSC
jgi:hypothetical protein